MKLKKVLLSICVFCPVGTVYGSQIVNFGAGINVQICRLVSSELHCDVEMRPQPVEFDLSEFVYRFEPVEAEGVTFTAELLIGQVQSGYFIQAYVKSDHSPFSTPELVAQMSFQNFSELNFSSFGGSMVSPDEKVFLKPFISISSPAQKEEEIK